MVNQSYVTLESLDLVTGILKESDRWYQVNSFSTLEVDLDYINALEREDKRRIMAPLDGLVTTEHDSLKAAEQYVRACLSFQHLFVLALVAPTREDFGERKDEFSSIYENEQQSMHKKGHIKLLETNTEFAKSDLTKFLHLNYSEAVNLYQSKGN